MNNRSICGVSQETARCSASTVWLFAGTPSIRTRRFSPPSRPVPSGPGSRPVPICTDPIMPPTSAETAQAALLPSAAARPTSEILARRRPRPGVRKETASSKLVLPAPFGPVSTIAEDETSIRAAP